MAFQISEPHPTARRAHTGRGGAGNTTKNGSSTITSKPVNTTSSESVTTTSKLSTPRRHHSIGGPTLNTNNISTNAPASSPSSPISPRLGRTSTGRGGAGNIHASSSLPPFSLASEMAAQVSREKGHTVWHVGRGGAGNSWSMAKERSSTRKNSISSEQSSAHSSKSSKSGGLVARISGVFERSWGGGGGGGGGER